MVLSANATIIEIYLCVCVVLMCATMIYSLMHYLYIICLLFCIYYMYVQT